MGFKDNSSNVVAEIEEPVSVATEPQQKNKVEIKSKSASKKGTKKPLGRPAIIIGAIVVGIIIVMILAKVLGGGKQTEDFFSITNAILDNEKGTFTYTFDVRTYPLGTDTSNMQNTDSSIDTDTADKEANSGKSNLYNIQNSEWGNTEGTQIAEWQYPKYCVTLDGRVISTEPYSMTMKITIATEYFNDVFTEITTYDGSYYINVEQMQYWLKNSGDGYLKKLSEKLPEGSKYLVIPEGELGWYSRFTENDETAVINNIEILLRRFITYQDVFCSYLQNGMVGNSETVSDGVYAFNLTDSNKLFNTIKGIVDRYGDYHKTYISSAVSRGLYDEAGSQQALNEIDNILSGLNDARLYLNNVNSEDLNLQLTGNARHYTSISNVDTYESTIRATWETDKMYDIQIGLSRSASGANIELPVGSKLTRDKLTSPTLVFDTIYDMIEYFNPTCIDLSKQLDINNSTIQTNNLQYLVNMINNSEYTNAYVTEHSILDFIDIYKSADCLSDEDMAIYTDNKVQDVIYAGDKDVFRGFDVDNLNGILQVLVDNGASEDLINFMYVYCYFVYLDNITDGLIMQVEIREEDTVQAREDFETELIDGVIAKVGINEDETNTQLLCLDISLSNPNGMDYSFNTEDMYVTDLLGSIYPVNSEVLLLNYDNNWDISKSPTNLIVRSHGYMQYKLYIVVDSTNGYLDLRMGNNILGVVQSY